MRYLVNLPLVGALLCGGMLGSLILPAGLPRAGDAALGASFAIVYGGILFWILVGASMVGCALAGGFDWLPGGGRGARVLLVLAGFAGIVLICILPAGIAIETAGEVGESRWSPAAIWAARAVGLGVPLLLLAYVAWVINAPEALRPLALPRYAALAGVAVLLAAGAVVSVRQLAEWNGQAVAEAGVRLEQENAEAAAHRRAFEALTDADTLFVWHGYTYHSSPDDIRLEAMRRIAARPALESELIAALQSDNPLWAAEGVRLVADLAFMPTPRLAEAVQRRLDGYAQSLTREAAMVTYEGDKRLDYYEQSRLRESLRAVQRLAEVPGADLRPQIDALAAAVALYPKSDTARGFPREAAQASKQVAARFPAPR